MADKIDTETRSRIMSRIKSKDTIPELIIRRGLFSRGLRYRLHRHDLPGRPDILFPRFKKIIMIHGCFWHGHDCRIFHKPLTNTDYWDAKIERNRNNDLKAKVALEKLDWQIITIWECQIKGRNNVEIEELLDRITNWLKNGLSISGVGFE